MVCIQSFRFSHIALKSSRSSIEYSLKQSLGNPVFRYYISSSSCRDIRVFTFKSISFIIKEYITFSPSIRKTSKICVAISGELSYRLAMNIVITISVKYGARFSTICSNRCSNNSGNPLSRLSSISFKCSIVFDN